jgi:hypothetical protein
MVAGSDEVFEGHDGFICMMPGLTETRLLFAVARSTFA